MATKIFARLLAQNDKLIYAVKKRLRKEAETKVNSLKNKLPSQSQLLNKFNNRYCSPTSIKKSEKNYKKYKSLIDKIEKKVQGAEKSIENLKKKLQKVLNNLQKIKSIGEKLKSIIDKLTKVVAAANIIIKGIGFIPSTQYFPNPSGPIVLAKDLVEKALAKIVLINAAITGALAAITMYAKKVGDMLNGIINSILSVIKNLLNKLKMIRQMLELYFLKLLRSCSLTGGSYDGSSSTGGPGSNNVIPFTSAGGRPLRPEEYLAAIGYPGYSLDNIDLETSDPTNWGDELGEFYDNTIANLTLAGRTEFIEKIFNADFQMVGFSRFFEGVDFDFVTGEKALTWASDYSNNPPNYEGPTQNYMAERNNATFQQQPSSPSPGYGSGGVANNENSGY